MPQVPAMEQEDPKAIVRKVLSSPDCAALLRVVGSVMTSTGLKKHLQVPLNNSMREAASEMVTILNRALISADPIEAQRERLMLIGRMLMAYPGDSSEEGTIARAAVYLESLDDIPPWALQEGIRQWNRGEAGDQNYAFAPPPAVLRRLALSHIARPQRVVEKLQELLDAAPSFEAALRVNSSAPPRANFEIHQLASAKVK